ncbi:MAG: hypothetical protein P8Y62_07255, partial [candidate division WOR-3 bacterium]
FYNFRGPYMGTMGSDYQLWLHRGTIKRSIPYKQIATIEFDKSLGENYYKRPKVIMKDGNKLKLKEDETAKWVGYSYKITGNDETGDKIQISTRDVRLIKFH